jgi:hypothetical protein
MNKTQSIVAENNYFDFYTKCQKLLNNGWKVIPGTISTSISYHNDRDKSVLVAFFENEYYDDPD